MKFSIRFGALIALLLYAVLVIIAVRFLVHNILFALILGLTVAIMLYGLWMLFSGTGSRLRRGGIIVAFGIVAFAFEALYFVNNIDNSTVILIFLAAGTLYIILINFLREKFWLERRLAGAKTRSPAKFKKPYLIINPKSGNGRAIKAKIPELAAERGIEVYITKKGDNIESMVRRAAKNGADVLGVSGGDGTIGAAAKVAVETSLPLVVLPGGTRCHFARDIGMDPNRITDALESFNGVKRKIDAGLINGRMFLNNASFGIYADIVNHDEYRDNKVATTRKVLQELSNGKRKSYSLKFIDNHGKSHAKAIQVFIGVNPYETMNLLELGHREQLDTGKLQITALTRLDDATIKRLMSLFSFKRQLGSSTADTILQWTAKEFTVGSSQNRLTAGVDGEREFYKTPVKITIMPKSLTLMVPAEGARPRQKSPFGGSVIGKLWDTVIGK